MTARIVDPLPYFGIDSGMRRVTVTAREKATLLAAAKIVEEAHQKISDELGDGHYDLPDAVDLCLAGPALRGLANGEVEW